MATTVTPIEVRLYIPNGDPQRRVLETPKLSFNYGAADTTGSISLFTSSLFDMAIVTLPDFTNAVTGALSLVNRYSVTVFSLGSISKNQTTLVSPKIGSDLWNIPFTEGACVLTLSGAPGGTGGEAFVTLYFV